MCAGRGTAQMSGSTLRHLARGSPNQPWPRVWKAPGSVSSVSLQEYDASVSTTSKPNFSCLKGTRKSPDLPPPPKYSPASGVTLSTVFSLPVDVSQHHSQPFAHPDPTLLHFQRRSVANIPFVLLRETKTQKNYFLSGKKTEAESRVSKTHSMILDPPT